MSYDVNPGNIEWVAKRVGQALDGGQFNTGEVIMGLAEALGRVIVATAETPIEGTRCAQVMLDHVKRTIHAGYSAKGYRMGELD